MFTCSRTYAHFLLAVIWTKVLLPMFQVRKMAYIQGNSVPRANLKVLDELIAARHELAQVVYHIKCLGIVFHTFRQSDCTS